MQLPGATPLSSINPIQTQDLHLRLNQRLVAEVVEVAGTRVVLSVNGTPIVARLEASAAGAQLAGRKVAQFVITSLANGEIELKLAETVTSPSLPSSPKLAGEVAFNVLEQLGLEKNELNLMLARAAISQRLQVTPELLDEMQAFLETMKAWGQDEAALAAAIKAAGLPLTDGVFQLASMRFPAFGRAVTDLAAMLQTALSSKHMSPELTDALREALTVLNRAVLAWGGGEPVNAGDVRASVETFGQSMENALLTLLKSDGASPGESGLLKLANLHRQLLNNNETGLAEKLNTFLTGLERGQLANLRPDPVPGQGEWCAAQFLLQGGQQRNELSPARVRIARGDGSKTGKINGASTRLVIGVDVSPDQTIQVDLTLVNGRARALVVTPDPELQRRSQEEMPSLINGLRSLGIQVIDSRFVVGLPDEDDLLNVLPLSELANRRINIKI